MINRSLAIAIKARLNVPRAKRALAMARAWIGDISPPEVLTYTELETAQRFISGHAIFMRHWMEYWKDIEAEDSAVRGRVGLLPLG